MYVALEGIDGVGKTTQLHALHTRYPNSIMTKEPGATPLGMRIREILLHENLDISENAELFLFLADRAEHATNVVRPALREGKSVFSDRSLLSGLAYTRSDADEAFLLELNRFALDRCMPHKTIILTLDEASLKTRFIQRNASEDRIEKRGWGYLLATQERLIYFAEKLGLDYKVIDANQPIATITATIKEYIDD